MELEIAPSKLEQFLNPNIYYTITRSVRLLTSYVACP
jgi:hypothetical protein